MEGQLQGLSWWTVGAEIMALEEVGKSPDSSRWCLRENEREGLFPGSSYILVNLASQFAQDSPSLCRSPGILMNSGPLSFNKCPGLIISGIFILLVSDETHCRILVIRETG